MTRSAPDAHNLSMVVDDGGYYIRTFSGHKFFWDKIETNKYDIADIAHALANNCRWTGHVKEYYSVAQHCVYASREAPPDLALAALLHDAAEAYVHDTPSPLKWFLAEHNFTEFSNLEKRIDRAVFKQYGLTYPMDPKIKEIDRRLLATEQRDLMSFDSIMEKGILPYDWIIRPLDPPQAEAMFRRRFNHLWSVQHAQAKAA